MPWPKNRNKKLHKRNRHTGKMVPGARTVCKSESGKNNDKKKKGDIRVPSKDLTMPMCVPLARPPMHTQTNIHMYIAEVYLLQCSSNVAPSSPGMVPCTLCISPLLPHDSLSAFLHARFVPLFHPVPFSALPAPCNLVSFHWSAFIRYLSHVPPSLTLFFSLQQRPKMDSLPGPE